MGSLVSVINLTVNPTIARLGPLALTWNMVCMAAGLVLALLLGLRAARRRGLDEGEVASFLAWALIGGLAGGWCLQLAEHLAYFWAWPDAALAIWQGGISPAGALFGGLVVLARLARSRRLPLLDLLDALAPGLILGFAVGQLGGFLSGSTVGAPTGGPWGVIYWHPDALVPPKLLGVPTQPTALYVIGGSLLLLVALRLGRSRLTRPGAGFLVTLLVFAGGSVLLGRARPAVGRSVALAVVNLGLLALALVWLGFWLAQGHRGRFRQRRRTGQLGRAYQP